MFAQGQEETDITVGCALGTSLDLWDICIGQTEVIGKLADFTKFLPSLGTTLEYLIVQQKVKEPSFSNTFSSVFSPFSFTLWMTCIAFLVVFGLAFALLERDGDDFEGSPGVHQKLATTLYKTFLSGVTGGPAYEPGTAGGKLVMLGYGWFILIALASYTANLASLLVVASSVQGIANMDDLIKTEGAKLCVPQDIKVTEYTELYPALGGRIISSGGTELALEDLLAGKCQGTAMGVGELEVLQSLPASLPGCCDLAAVGSPLSELSNAYPVSLEYVERLSPLVSSKLHENQLSQLFKEARPKSACPSRTAASATLGPGELAGVFIPSTGLLVLGLLVGLMQQLLRKKRQQSKC